MRRHRPTRSRILQLQLTPGIGANIQVFRFQCPTSYIKEPAEPALGHPFSCDTPICTSDASSTSRATCTADAGNPAMPRNAGTRRTASKRALLEAIEDAGGKW